MPWMPCSLAARATPSARCGRRVIMRMRRGAWGSACSTTPPSRRAMPSAITVWGASSSWIGTCITATARRTSLDLNAARGMGFCLFNNAAIAARYAQRNHGVGRVLIVDWDVHHGNGTQDIFYRDASVFFFSSHQWPLYPGTGRADETGDGPGEGATMNFPFPAGAGRREILGAVENHLLPAAARFQPDLVLISAGFDSRVGDPLGRFTLTDIDFADLTRAVMGIAGGRVVSVLEGGYNLAGLASAAAAHVAALLG